MGVVALILWPLPYPLGCIVRFCHALGGSGRAGDHEPATGGRSDPAASWFAWLNGCRAWVAQQIIIAFVTAAFRRCAVRLDVFAAALALLRVAWVQFCACDIKMGCLPLQNSPFQAIFKTKSRGMPTCKSDNGSKWRILYAPGLAQFARYGVLPFSPSLGTSSRKSPPGASVRRKL